ncbi:MAG: hypothetical protein ABIJ39_08975 [Chloroflexota bacterium]
MSLSRRDFIKLFGASVASLVVARCNWQPPATPTVTCYDPAIPPDLPPSPPSSARERLRLLWLRFPELAQAISKGGDQEDTWDNLLGQEMIADHRLALDDLVAEGQLSSPVADLVHEAYSAAIDHTWRSNIPITCYEAVIVDYTPASAAVLIQQTQVLGELADQGTIDPATLATVRTALEHDLAYYALSDSDVNALYDKLLVEYQQSGGMMPTFEQLELELTPDARAAAQFIIGLLTNP